MHLDQASIEKLAAEVGVLSRRSSCLCITPSRARVAPRRLQQWPSWQNPDPPAACRPWPRGAAAGARKTQKHWRVCKLIDMRTWREHTHTRAVLPLQDWDNTPLTIEEHFCQGSALLFGQCCSIWEIYNVNVLL